MAAFFFLLEDTLICQTLKQTPAPSRQSSCASAGRIDLAHAAFPEEGGDVVVAEAGADVEGHKLSTVQAQRQDAVAPRCVKGSLLPARCTAEARVPDAAPDGQHHRTRRSVALIHR